MAKEVQFANGKSASVFNLSYVPLIGGGRQQERHLVIDAALLGGADQARHVAEAVGGHRGREVAERRGGR